MSRTRILLAAILLALLSVVLAALVSYDLTQPVDDAIRSLALSLNTNATVSFWRVFTLLGSVPVMTGLSLFAIALFALWSNWVAAKLLTLSMGGAAVLDIGSKWWVHRPRPSEVYAHTMPTSFSFPSGHALYSFVFFITLWWIASALVSEIWSRVILSSCLLVVILIGSSRVFLGVHYPSDVLGGYLIAVTWLLCVLSASGNLALSRPGLTL